MKKTRWTVGAGIVLSVSLLGVAMAQDDSDVAFAEALWTELAEQRLLGPDAIAAVPFPREGGPHPATLVQLEARVTVSGVTGLAIVKRGYQPIPREEIVADPNNGLAVITVMFRRDAGYDSVNQDWFYAGFTPNGSIISEGGPVAGRVPLCIGCHATAPGADYVFLHDGIELR